MSRNIQLKDLAKVIRSKNAGPFEITFDIIFETLEDFETVRRSGAITREVISTLYNVPTQAILTFEYFAVAKALKITIPRPQSQGSIGETDMHAAQQHAPLMRIAVEMPDR